MVINYYVVYYSRVFSVIESTSEAKATLIRITKLSGNVQKEVGAGISSLGVFFLRFRFFHNQT